MASATSWLGVTSAPVGSADCSSVRLLVSSHASIHFSLDCLAERSQDSDACHSQPGSAASSLLAFLGICSIVSMALALFHSPFAVFQYYCVTKPPEPSDRRCFLVRHRAAQLYVVLETQVIRRTLGVTPLVVVGVGPSRQVQTVDRVGFPPASSERNHHHVRMRLRGLEPTIFDA